MRNLNEKIKKNITEIKRVERRIFRANKLDKPSMVGLLTWQARLVAQTRAMCVWQRDNSQLDDSITSPRYAAQATIWWLDDGKYVIH